MHEERRRRSKSMEAKKVSNKDREELESRAPGNTKPNDADIAATKSARLPKYANGRRRIDQKTPKPALRVQNKTDLQVADEEIG
jgi:hypothetical protein